MSPRSMRWWTRSRTVDASLSCCAVPVRVPRVQRATCRIVLAVRGGLAGLGGMRLDRYGAIWLGARVLSLSPRVDLAPPHSAAGIADIHLRLQQTMGRIPRAPPRSARPRRSVSRPIAGAFLYDANPRIVTDVAQRFGRHAHRHQLTRRARCQLPQPVVLDDVAPRRTWHRNQRSLQHPLDHAQTRNARRRRRIRGLRDGL